MYYYFLTSYLLSKIELVARANLPMQIAPHYSHYSHYPHYSHPKFAHFLIIHYLCPTISKFAN